VTSSSRSSADVTGASGPAPTGRALARDALGLGLRPVQLAALRSSSPAVDFFEIIAENFLGRSDLPRRNLTEVAARFPVVAHNVSLNLLGTDPLDLDHLRRLRALVEEHRMPCVTDHLCFASSQGVHLHDLLPVPLSSSLVPWAIDRIRAVQDILGVPFGIENASTYLRFTEDDLSEQDFLRRIVDGAGCGLLLDINNVFVASVNHHFDSRAFLDAIPWDRVLYVHLAGHQRRNDGLRHDTHDRAVDDDVWALYREAWRRGGPFPTLLEWDDHIPTLDVAVGVLRRALEVRA